MPTSEPGSHEQGLAASPATSHAHAANLRSSLELATFTLAI